MDTLGLGDHVVPEATNTCSPPTEQVVAAHVEKDRQEEKTVSTWVALQVQLTKSYVAAPSPSPILQTQLKCQGLQKF